MIPRLSLILASIVVITLVPMVGIYLIHGTFGVKDTTYEQTTWHRGEATETTDIAQKIEPGKTSWDWLSLVLVPVGLAGIGFLVNQAQNHSTQRRTQDTTLQKYFDRIDTLYAQLQQQKATTHRKAERAKLEKEVHDLIGAHTLAALLTLDKNQKRHVLKLLTKLQLLTRKSDSDETEAPPKLKAAEVDISDAALDGADLTDANLPRIDLHKVYLTKANLNNANLREADLRGAHLSGAHLSGADLSGADLRGAKNLTKEQIASAIRDKNTKLPDGIGG